MAQINHDLNNFLNKDLVYKNFKEWERAPCWHRIYTYPESLDVRVKFINEIVDLINRYRNGHELNTPEMKENVIKRYIPWISLYCGSRYDWTVYIPYYIESLGRNKSYYPDNIKWLHGRNLEETKKFLSEDVMNILEDEVKRIRTKEKEEREKYSSTTDTGHFDVVDGVGLGLESMVPRDGGKIRSAKRHPRRKSSTIKRHPRRKSSAIKRRPRRRRTSRK